MRRDDIVADLKADFIKGIDYREADSIKDTSRPFAPEISGAKGLKERGGYNKETISLSVDCFKQFGMMISGDRGRDGVRHRHQSLVNPGEVAKRRAVDRGVKMPFNRTDILEAHALFRTLHS